MLSHWPVPMTNSGNLDGRRHRRHRTTTKTTETSSARVTNTWPNPRCLRATVTYRDAIDRTHAEQDDNDTAVDETLEGTFKGSEYPVKPIDEGKRCAGSSRTAGGIAVSSYTAERREDATGTPTFHIP